MLTAHDFANQFLQAYKPASSLLTICLNERMAELELRSRAKPMRVLLACCVN